MRTAVFLTVSLCCTAPATAGPVARSVADEQAGHPETPSVQTSGTEPATGNTSAVEEPSGARPVPVYPAPPPAAEPDARWRQDAQRKYNLENKNVIGAAVLEVFVPSAGLFYAEEYAFAALELVGIFVGLGMVIGRRVWLRPRRVVRGVGGIVAAPLLTEAYNDRLQSRVGLAHGPRHRSPTSGLGTLPPVRSITLLSLDF